ncbi:MAG: PilZ domain-containing protein [Pseudomonadota bacterium]|nr:PilZ domain-containing protein [Pseudomonadota bacterium]
MASAAQLSVAETRRSNRCRVNCRLPAQHRSRGEFLLHIANISTDGFMTASATGMSRGERVVVRLPQVGLIEAHLVWSLDERAGFQFERIIRSDDFDLMIAAIRLRPVS